MNDENPNESAANQGTAASELQNRATQDLSQVASQAKGDLDAVTQRAAQDARELGAQAKEKVGEVTQQATEQAKSFAADQKGLAAEQINGVASAITRVADELGTEQPTIARYARDLASSLSGFGKTVGEKDVDDLMGMAQSFGRSQPIAFLGAAALAGFVASRFALASAHRRDTRSSDTTYGGSNTADTYGGSNAGSNYGAGSGGSYGSSSGSSGSSGSYSGSGTSSSSSSYGSSTGSNSYGAGSSSYGSTGSSDNNRTGGQ